MLRSGQILDRFCKGSQQALPVDGLDTQWRGEGPDNRHLGPQGEKGCCWLKEQGKVNQMQLNKKKKNQDRDV